MANKKIDKDRIIELFKKQSEEDKLYIINEMIKSLSVNEGNTKLREENEKLKLKLKLYRENSPKIVNDHIANQTK